MNFKQITDRVLAELIPSLAEHYRDNELDPEVMADFLIENVDVVRNHYQLKHDDILRVVSPTYIAVSVGPGMLDMQPKTAYPSMMKMAKNLLGAATTTLKQALTGQQVEVDQPEYERRIGICGGCDKWEVPADDAGNPQPEQGRCRACGCFTKFKLRLAGQSCPEGKWSAWTPS